MKPTEHQSPLEKELIARIRESLLEHEESYPLGAWEKFNAPEKKTRPAFWIPLLQVAAALLIIGFISFLILNKKTRTEPIAKVDVDGNKPKTQAEIPTDTQVRKAIIVKEPVENTGLPHANQTVENNVPDKHKQNQLSIVPIETQIIDQQIKIANNGTINMPKQMVQIGIESTTVKSSQEVVSTDKPVNPSTNIIDFLENETKSNKTQKTENVAIIRKGNLQ